MTTPKANIVKLRLTDLEKSDWQNAAGGARKLSEWIRSICNAATEQSRGGEVAGNDQPQLVTPEAPLPNSKPLVVSDAITRDTTPKQCDRWMHHRPGVYCGTCKKVIGK